MGTRTWMENWTHVGCGWRVFLEHRGGETLLVAQGLNVLAAELLRRELAANAHRWSPGATFDVSLPEAVWGVVMDADGAKHKGVLRELADGTGPAATQAACMLASMREHG